MVIRATSQNVSSESVKPIIIDEFRLTWYINRMEHQKIINLLVNESITPSKFRAKSWNNDDSHGTDNSIEQIKLKNKMFESSLYYYSDAYLLVKGTILVIGQEANYE